MISLILWCLALYFLYVVTPPVMQYLGGNKPLGAKLMIAMGPRDTPPPMTALADRAARAHKNFAETLPFFLTLALLLLYTNKTDMLGFAGAQVFLGARVFYLPAYLSGVPGLRSFVWTVGAGGIVMMLIRLIQ